MDLGAAMWTQRVIERVETFARGVRAQATVRRCVAGYRLPCGCLVGVYERVDGGVITLIDVPMPACPEGGAHARSAELPATSAAR
jgi:hypothetical protein